VYYYTYMLYSRLKKYEEQRQQRKIFLSLAGIVAIFVFLAIFGLKLLTGFSILVDTIRGKNITTIQEDQLILPPELDPIPSATNSAKIAISGKGTAGLTVILYINDMDTQKETVDTEGVFRFSTVSLIDGSNTFSAKLTDDKNHISALSDVLTIAYKKSKPTLEITSPADGTQIRGEQNTITISGKTEDTNSVTINGRVVVMHADGSFSHEFSLGEGDTTLHIIATDPAGNQTTVERKINYAK